MGAKIILKGIYYEIKNERAYEKLELYGPEMLSNAELLAIIIKTGTKEKTAIQIAQEVLSYDYEKNGVIIIGW